MEKQYLFLFLALISEIIGTVSGFGSSILFVPVASLFFDFKTVLGITALFHVFSNLSKIALFRKGIDLNIAVKLGVPAVIFVITGAWLTTLLPTAQIELFMSVMLVGLSGYLLRYRNKGIQKTDANLYAGGVVSGFLAGIAGTGGAIRGITLAAFHLPKDMFVATSALIDLGVDASRAVVYTSNGYVHTRELYLLPGLLVVSIVGSYMGKRLLQRTSEEAFRYIVLSVIIAVSILQVLRYIYK